MDRTYPVTDLNEVLHILYNIDTGDTDFNMRLDNIYKDLYRLHIDIIYKELSKGLI